MYICKNCGAVFEEPIKGFEEEKDSCPICGDWDFVEAKKCRACGEPCTDDLCKDCEDQIKEAFYGFVDMYAEEIGITRRYITEIIESCL